jgi:hypothetical protein
MPSYDLQAGQANGTKIDCGNVVASMTGSNPVFKYLAQGQSGNGTTISTAVYSPSGGGTAMQPQPGDTLNLGGFRAQGTDNNWYTFSTTATFQNQNGSIKKGYYYSAATSPAGGLGDWDAADGGSGRP